MAKPGKPTTEEQLDSGPSKSQLKRDMSALQEVGEQLAALPPAALARCELPERLLHSITEFQRLPNKHGARRRQLQYIGKLMRDLDPDTLQQVQRVLQARPGVSRPKS